MLGFCLRKERERGEGGSLLSTIMHCGRDGGTVSLGLMSGEGFGNASEKRGTRTHNRATLLDLSLQWRPPPSVDGVDRLARSEGERRREREQEEECTTVSLPSFCASLSLSLQGFRNQHHKGQTNSVRLMNFFLLFSSIQKGRPPPLFASPLSLAFSAPFLISFLSSSRSYRKGSLKGRCVYGRLDVRRVRE